VGDTTRVSVDHPGTHPLQPPRLTKVSAEYCELRAATLHPPTLQLRSYIVIAYAVGSEVINHPNQGGQIFQILALGL